MSFGPVIILTMSWTVNILNIHLLYSSGEIGKLHELQQASKLFPLWFSHCIRGKQTWGGYYYPMLHFFYIYLNPRLCVICKICPPSHWVSSGLVPGRARQGRPAFQLFFAEIFPLFKSLVLVPLVLYSVLKKGQINAQLCIVGPALYYWWCKNCFKCQVHYVH